MENGLKLLLSLALALVVSSAFAQNISSWKLDGLKAAIQDAKGPTVINFWATFCKPCLAELPHFQALANQYKSKGVKLILVSLDVKAVYPAKIASVVTKLKLTSPVIFLNETDADVFCPVVDSSWSGVIPATLFINNTKSYHRFYEEELSKEKLEAEIKKMLHPSTDKQ